MLGRARRLNDIQLYLVSRGALLVQNGEIMIVSLSLIDVLEFISISLSKENFYIVVCGLINVEKKGLGYLDFE